MNLEKVKKHFQNAKEVELCNTSKTIDITNANIIKDGSTYQAEINGSTKTDSFYNCLYGASGFARIVSYKEPIYTITKKQILELYNSGTTYTDNKIKEWFPDVFKTELEDDTYYIFEDGVIQRNVKKGIGYGINFFNAWVDAAEWLKYNHNGNFRKATAQEVETALFAEAKKRGYKEDICLISTSGVHGFIAAGRFVFSYESNKIYFSGFEIFDEGTWATIIPKVKLTRQQIADKFEVDINNLTILEV